LYGPDHLSNFLCRLTGSFGQPAHFIGDDGKTFAMLAGPSRFNRRV